MEDPMLSFCKKVLQRVSFDEGLFRHELHKSLRRLNEDQAAKLKDWVTQTFGELEFAADPNPS